MACCHCSFNSNDSVDSLGTNDLKGLEGEIKPQQLGTLVSHREKRRIAGGKILLHSAPPIKANCYKHGDMPAVRATPATGCVMGKVRLIGSCNRTKNRNLCGLRFPLPAENYLDDFNFRRIPIYVSFFSLFSHVAVTCSLRAGTSFSRVVRQRFGLYANTLKTLSTSKTLSVPSA